MSYFEYLTTRSKLALLYRRIYLYPRLYRKLKPPIVDIGCGIGDFLSYKPDAVGLDIDAGAVSYCQQNAQTAYKFDGSNLPFDGGSFSSVVLDNVLEHIQEPEALLSDISRVIKPGGRFIVGVPGVKGYKSDKDHKVFYDEQRLIDLIERYQFKTHKVIHAPVKSKFLNKKISQYCIYASFIRD
ncbi:class I SAM-dependent methyltransferase [Alphaproteobacteria bacterium]|nr:class I SAM-dependent methyltransferase [Alphaproteobacteria bacterium]